MSTTAERLRDVLAMPERPRSLWAISDALETVAERIAENGGELTEALEAELEAIEGEFSHKVERVALYVRDLEIKAEGAKVEKDRLAAIQKANETKAAGLKRYLLAIMERQGRDKVDTSKVRVSRVQSTASYRWEGDTFEQIPDDFRRTRVVCTLDVDAVKRHVGEGNPLPEHVVMERGHHIRLS